MRSFDKTLARIQALEARKTEDDGFIKIPFSTLSPEIQDMLIDGNEIWGRMIRASDLERDWYNTRGFGVPFNMPPELETTPEERERAREARRYLDRLEDEEKKKVVKG